MDLQERLRRIELENRRLKICGMIAASAMAALILMGQCGRAIRLPRGLPSSIQPGRLSVLSLPISNQGCHT
jgi:hypothetical protein